MLGKYDSVAEKRIAIGSMSSKRAAATAALRVIPAQRARTNVRVTASAERSALTPKIIQSELVGAVAANHENSSTYPGPYEAMASGSDTAPATNRGP
jgi:hypothetical protein